MLLLVECVVEIDVVWLMMVYENMKLWDVVDLFLIMVFDFVVGFIGCMNLESVVVILMGFEFDVVYVISVVLVGRNVDVLIE